MSGLLVAPMMNTVFLAFMPADRPAHARRYQRASLQIKCFSPLFPVPMTAGANDDIKLLA
eukprot:7380531-Pyramimonas_sp.AAC.2